MCNTKDADNNTDQNLDKTPENNDDQRVSVRFFKIILILTLLFAIVQIINCHLAKKRQDKICNLLYRTISIPNPLDTVFYSAMIIDSSVDKLDNLTIEKKLSIISSQNFHNRDEINYNQDIIQTIENVEKLLHLEFAKIQEERNALTLWIGIITVVFLIFSFYSMFKSDDLVKQSQDGLNDIKEIKKEVTKTKEKYDEDLEKWKTGMSDLQNKYSEEIKNIETKYKNIYEELEKNLTKRLIEKNNELNGNSANNDFKNGINDIHEEEKKLDNYSIDKKAE